jgi:cytochrome c oxidase assembly factor CtaG
VTSLLPVRWHPALWAGVVLVGLAYVLATRRGRFAATRGQRARFVLALALFVIACGWPLGDLAAHVSLTALVVQRLVLMLAIAPLALSGLPDELLLVATRPRPIDRVLVALGHPGAAIAFVTVAGTVTLVPTVVRWGSDSQAARWVLVLATLLIGVVLWLPVLGSAPGTRRLSDMAKAAYCFISALVVTSLSVVWIFARHPLYPSLTGQRAILGISPLLDQQLAGFVAKLGAYVPMWIVAFVLFARAGDGEERGDPTLRWVDVQRQFERAERRGGVPLGDGSPT